VIQKTILDRYVNSYKNDVRSTHGSILPEVDTFPPYNEASAVIPPTKHQ